MQAATLDIAGADHFILGATASCWCQAICVCCTAAFEFDLESEKLAQAAETAAATSAAAVAHGDPTAVLNAKRAVAAEIALVRQRMWEEIQVSQSVRVVEELL